MKTQQLAPIAWRVLSITALCAGLMLTGCMTQPTNVYAPGTIEMQRRRAIRLDPYPDQDIAPEIVGGRPREYDKDRSETNRAKLLREAWWGSPF